MPIVSYIREHTRFIEYASDEHLSSSERLLWYALMHIFNQRAQGSDWPDEFIRINNDRLLTLCPMGYDALAKARNSLKQRGLIEVLKGERNKVSPAYRMIYFYPNKTDNVGGNTGDNMGGNPWDKPQGKAGDFNKDYTEYPYDRQNYGKRDEDTANNPIRWAIRASWARSFGNDPAPAIVDMIESWGARTYQMETEVIREAIRRAALRNADDPVSYVVALLRDWGLHRVKTVRELDEYLDED